MGEAPTGGGGGRADLERSIARRSLQDEGFRRRLLADPKGTVEQELGARLPEGVEVRALEETPDTVYLVVPGAPPIGGGAELSDRELEAVAGGSDTWLECGPVTSPQRC